MKESLNELWIKHSSARFPKGYGGVDVKGICVTTTDTFAAGCISTYMSTESKNLEIEKVQILMQCKKDLEFAVPALSGEAYEYFGRLHEMCRLILEEVNVA